MTEEKCSHHILVRGLVRVRLVAEAKHVLRFLTLKGIINHGAIGKIPGSISAHKEKVEIRQIITNLDTTIGHFFV